jgi:hypothetical protein
LREGMSTQSAIGCLSCGAARIVITVYGQYTPSG